MPNRLINYPVQNIFSYGMPAAHRFIVLIGVADIIHIMPTCVGYRLSDGRCAAVAAINAAGIYRYGYITRTAMRVIPQQFLNKLKITRRNNSLMCTFHAKPLTFCFCNHCLGLIIRRCSFALDHHAEINFIFQNAPYGNMTPYGF